MQSQLRIVSPKRPPGSLAPASMRRAFVFRLRSILGVFVLVALVLVARLYFISVVYGSDFALRAERQYVNESSTIFDRGSIFMTRKDGELISAATLQNGFLIAINPASLKDPEAAYQAIAQIASVSRDEFFAHAAKTDDPYEEILHRLPEELGAALAAKKIPGVLLVRERWRVYPGNTLGAHVVGFVASDSSGELAGRYGIERSYNDVLVRDASALYRNFFADLFANVGSIILDAHAAREGDVITTLEPSAERHLEDALKTVGEKWGSRETGGIIMNPKTGEIVAMAVYPSFDPNNFQDADAALYIDPLVEHVYEFGSIMKPLTIASGIDAGVITPRSTYNDTGTLTLDGKTIANFDGQARGVISTQEILNQSLNVGAAHVANLLGPDRLRSYFLNLGMGEETGIDLPSETHGIVTNLNSPRKIEYATASFGQGIALTPIEMIRALASLANEGQIVTPHLAREVRLRSGISKEVGWGLIEPVFTPETAETVSRMLVTVVDTALANGTMKIPELSVAAKTGTAQIPAPGGGYYDDRYFHSFFGYFPAFDPKFIILLYTREPRGVRYASETLTKPFFDLVSFLASYYAIPPDRPPRTP